jgi:glycerol-3-phosphate acyltransferase PlsY
MAVGAQQSVWLNFQGRRKSVATSIGVLCLMVGGWDWHVAVFAVSITVIQRIVSHKFIAGDQRYGVDDKRFVGPAL